MIFVALSLGMSVKSLIEKYKVNMNTGKKRKSEARFASFLSLKRMLEPEETLGQDLVRDNTYVWIKLNLEGPLPKKMVFLVQSALHILGFSNS